MRLALNIASTRLILSKGHLGTASAGHIIESFGTFVMQGSLVIGIIVFTILTIINFIVITKGSGRIAEVAARFSLDAMPGKQMAVDADLAAGIINEKEAQERRKELQAENTFFGAMDGSSKFVRGDAIAGILIIFINFIAGMIIGIIQRDMSFDKAIHTYTILTIGDGLISQIPALIISISAGLLVTKSGTNGSTDKDIMDQLSNYPRAIMVTSAFLLAIALVPGMPAIPFISLGIISGIISYIMHNIKKENAETIQTESSNEDSSSEDSISQDLHIDDVRIELGGNLLVFADNIAINIKKLRKQLASEFGFITPVIRIRDNMLLKYDSYSIKIKEIESGQGALEPNMLMVMNPTGKNIDLVGKEGEDPTFSLKVKWIDKLLKQEAISKGYTVINADMVIMTHLTEIIKNNMSELMTYSSTQKLLDEVGKEHQKLVSDIVPTKVGLGVIQHVLQKLLSEQVSIKDLPLILESIAEIYQSNQNIISITEHVRSCLARQISFSNKSESGYIPVISLSAKWEKVFAESIIDNQLAAEPSKIQEFINLIKSVFDKYALKGENPILLTSATVRPYIKMIIERFRSSLIILSQNEIHNSVKVKNFGNL